MSVNDFLDLMPATVTHRVFTGRDAFGKKTHDAGTVHRARVVFKQKMVRQADGQLVMAAGMVWFAAAPVVNPDDLVVLPDGSTPPILAVDRMTDETPDVHHTKVYFG